MDYKRVTYRHNRRIHSIKLLQLAKVQKQKMLQIYLLQGKGMQHNISIVIEDANC